MDGSGLRECQVSGFFAYIILTISLRPAVWSLRDLKILQLLHRMRGQVVDRATMFDECWGLRHVAHSRTLDQHISQLRKRIERDPKQPRIIRPVPGVGYRYE